MGNYRQLTKEELAWSKNLKAIYTQKKTAEKLTMIELGDRLGMSASAISQYMNGKIAMNLPAKVAFAIGLGCDVNAIDPAMPYQPPLSAEEQAMIDAYRQTSQKGRKAMLAISEASPAYRLDHQDKK